MFYCLCNCERQNIQEHNILYRIQCFAGAEIKLHDSKYHNTFTQCHLAISMERFSIIKSHDEERVPGFRCHFDLFYGVCTTII